MFSVEGMAAALKKGTPVDCRFGESDVYHRGVVRNRYRKQCDQYVVDFEDGETLVMLLAESGEHIVWRRVGGEGVVRDETSEDARPTEREIVQERVTEEIVVRYDLIKTLCRSGRQIPCGQKIIYLKGECERLPNGDYQMTYGPTKYFPRRTQDRLTVRQYEECKRRVRDDEHDLVCFHFADTVCDDVDETERGEWQAIRRCSGTSIASLRSEPAACSGQRFHHSTRISHNHPFLITATIGMFDY